MRIRLKSPDLYAIGWIAALPIERVVATALLHDRHDAPEGFSQHRSDKNSYTWGRIGEHNVVIASLPAGVYGLASAATTASNLVHSLPHIRISLLVGIGGGIARPNAGYDIRLGDVVVSQPDGTIGGVVQYDLGKATANGGWERKGSLDKPPAVLLHALASLQAEHEIAGSKVPDLLQAMFKANPRMTRPKTSFTYQGAEKDRLFKSQHNHAGGSNCDKCDSAWEVERDQRESTDPEIHYGIIASGNKLIKDAAIRDSLFEDTGHQCLCVEMEAAGLMNRFPCLVIRGVCDYADSHKNDRWQRYAAATAAAFAVELLEYIPAAQLEATQTVIGAIQTFKRKADTISAHIQNVNYRTAFDQLPVAEGAFFNSKAEEHNPTCLPDTREELLKEIDCWIDDPTSKTIFWLNGMAGTGKSTISRTVAHSRAKRGDLGASFFFKRGEIDRGNPNKLMPTLAYQLALSMPEVAFFVKEELDANPAIVGKSVEEQFQKLIQEPLSEAAASAKVLSPVVIVIDALDECDQEADIRLLINILSRAKTSLPHLRVFLTSRPVLSIRLGFSEAQGSYQDLVLHEIPAQIVEHDIVVFLDDEFRKIRHDFNMTVSDERKLPPDWPGSSTVQSLAQISVPLFIYAATVCRFIGDRRRNSPPIQLHKTLDYESKGHVSQLDRIYGPILCSLITDVSENDEEQIIKDFKIIVGSIVSLASPLSTTALSHLIEIPAETVDERLDALHSVLNIPLNRNLPVRLCHQSFRDYLVINESEFRIDEKVAHHNLARHCLSIMRGALHENMCDLSFSDIHRSVVDSIELGKHLSPELRYASIYWVHHQIKVDFDLNDGREIHDFLKAHFFHWVEVLSLLGWASDCFKLIQSLIDWLMNRDLSLSDFLANALLFLETYLPVIVEKPLQIYPSAVAFAWKENDGKKAFEFPIPGLSPSLHQVQEDRDARLMLETVSDTTASEVFGPAWSDLENSTHPSSFTQEFQDRGSGRRPTMTFLNYQTSEPKGQTGDLRDYVQSVISLPDDIGSWAEPGHKVNEVRHAAVTYLINTLTGDSELFALYREATQKIQQARFIDNHRRLLKGYFLRLREDCYESAQRLAIEILRPRHLRILISQGIWNLAVPSNDNFRELFSRALEQDKDKHLILNRYLGEGPGLKDPAAVNSWLGNTGASDQESSNSDLAEDDQAENILSHLEATREFFITGQPFHVYQDSLYQFLKSTTTLATTPECITSRSYNTSTLDDKSVELGIVAEHHRVEQQSGAKYKTSEQAPTEAVPETVQQTEDLANYTKPGTKKNDFRAEHRQLIDEIEGYTLESGAKQASQYLHGLGSPTSQNNTQTSASSSGRRVLDVGMARIYGKILTFLSRISLREDDITPGHHRIRWRNNRGKLLHDDYIEHEAGALRALEDYLNSLAYSPTTSSTSGRGSNPTTSVSAGSFDNYAQANTSESGDIADQYSRSAANTGCSSFQKDLEIGKLSTSTLHVLSCMTSRKYTMILHEESVTHITNDRQLFQTLRERYFEHIGRLKRHSSLRTINAIHFMKFAYGGHRHIDVRCHPEICEQGKPCVCLPPANLVRPQGSEYDCAPVPPKFSPPIGPRLMMDFFTNPEEIGPNSTLVLRQLPKWTSGNLQSQCTEVEEMWGIYYKEDWDWSKIWWILGLGFFPPSLLFGVLWGILQQDIQGAFGVASWWMAGATIVVGIVGTSTWAQ
ncbi:unnamed protein product [Fusarium graminearum]|nr:unnamed protein product [Fusarium graminearum]CAG1975299.1 unnamed protein product [Fusarium graminearum]